MLQQQFEQGCTVAQAVAGAAERAQIVELEAELERAKVREGGVAVCPAEGAWVHLHEVINAFSNTICNTSDCMCDGVVNITIKMSLYTSSQVGPGRTGTRAGRSERLCETKLSRAEARAGLRHENRCGPSTVHSEN